MAYETLLNTVAQISGTPTTTLTDSYSASLFFNISGTTLGSSVSGIALYLDLRTAGTALSTLSATSTPTLTLSSNLFAPQVYTGYIVNSTLWPNTSATVTLGWNSPNLGTTSINLSAYKGGNTVLDPTKTNTMDNWFFYTTNPEPSQNRGVRTTLGHARLVSYLG